ncbi:hypothetical protein [Rhizobium mesosinicum]|uniref:Uncharacterized protein n=1 Tax=Rhizobium mesosinicum TaxID=335017 RepID=A0ABS7GM39_9HYPH|nr:hypothetical protein [Rhizobium mesosinicum]MBW9051051.1 hypothetical protein [Rhizobium mesosinicum]
MHLDNPSSWFCPGSTTPGGNGNYYPACELLVEDARNFDRSGKIILSDFSFPSADAVYDDRSRTISKQFLREYLSYLEVLVLYDKLLVVKQPYVVTAEDYEDKSSPIHTGFAYFDYAGDANLRESLDKLRAQESWIINTTFDLPDVEFQPTAYAAQTLALFGINKSDDGHMLHAADLYEAVFRLGQPYAAFEVARHFSLPFYGPKIEYHPLVLQMEKDVTVAERHIAHHFKKHLDAGAAAVLSELQKYQETISFSASPIGALILTKATKPAEMLTVALDLRDTYEPFRKHCQELENALFSPDTSPRDKLKIVAEINRILEKLWGRGEGGIERHIKSSANLVDYAIDASEGVFSAKKSIELLVSAPVKHVIDRIRDRKYRLLFDAKNSFLKQKSVEQAVAKLFSTGNNLAEVNFQEITCEHWWGYHPDNVAHDDSEPDLFS